MSKQRRWRGIDEFVNERSGVFVDNGGGRERRPDRPRYAGVLPPDVAAAVDQVQRTTRNGARLTRSTYRSTSRGDES